MANEILTLCVKVLLSASVLYYFSQCDTRSFFLSHSVPSSPAPPTKAKNLSHRQRVQKAPQSGLAIPGLSGSPTLPEDFVEEALLLSDILQLNEISSVELLLAGEQHMPRYLILYHQISAEQNVFITKIFVNFKDICVDVFCRSFATSMNVMND